ncbi:MAG: hypothetical protein AB7T48_04145 [Solirubrobacterales bacterium]
MTATMSVAARFNGPRESGNGGYTSGLLAAEVEGTAAVSLRSPVPLDTPLALVHEDGRVRAFDGETLVAEAEPVAPLALEVPAPVSVEEARQASATYRHPRESPFATCFVCGPAREDSFGVFAGAVAGRDLVATPWTPPPWSAGEDGAVRPEFVWAALDCPTFFAAYGGEMRLAFMVRDCVELRGPVRAGVEHVVIAWPLTSGERKRSAGAAVLDCGGALLAVGEVLLVEPRAA